MADDPAGQTQTDSQTSDPYVIYQLRKPSQRGTAVIPRYVPNTHAPAFSPANYRFARVWTANDNTAVSPSNLLHAPRSFEYAGSLGSESSFWSDTTSWLSVSSLRTAPSEQRAPLLHSNQPMVSAASFFSNDLENTRIRNSFRASSARSSEIDSPIRTDFHYPPALSESVSEDAVIDDLLSLQKPQFPHIRNHSNTHATSRDHSGLHKHSSHRRDQSSSHNRSHNARSNPNRSTLLPTLTRKRRWLWQWLFCTNKAAMSTTVPSVSISQTATAARHRIRTTNSAAHAQKSNAHTRNLRRRSSNKPQPKDRVSKADKDFLDRTQRAADVPAGKTKGARRRNPSFEIRRGRPSGTTKSGRSMSWNFMPKGLLGRDRDVQKESKEKKKKSKGKDKPRQLPPEEAPEPRKKHRIVFQRSSTRRGMHTGKEASKDQRRPVPKETQQTLNVKSRNEAPKATQSDVDRLRDDRLREDRPRELSKPLLEKITGVSAPQPKSIVPSLREKQKSGSSQIQRMRSNDSSDPVTSRISSDLSTTTYGQTNDSDGSRSASNRLRPPYSPTSHELDPAAHGVSSDVSSQISGAVGKTSPVAIRTDPVQDYSNLSSPEIRGIDPSIMSRDSPHRPPLFAVPSSSSGSGGFNETQSQTTEWDGLPADYSEYTNMFGNFGSTAPELIATMDPVARAKEKNRARSAGGPLSYLMKQHDPDEDANTQSTGLTSLADESVSTHKTVSVAGDEYQYRSQLPGGLHRYLYGDTHKSPTAHEAQDSRSVGSTGQSRPIFQNYALSPSHTKSPSHTSSGASPRRFHSDWSDPHATDIDVYCQCNCSCVYEEECRRSCELVYGRSPSVSSTRSRQEYKGFKTLPPTIEMNGRKTKTLSVDTHKTAGYEPIALQNGMRGTGPHRQSPQKTYLRANAVDELPDPESERFYSEAYKSSQPGQGISGSAPGVYAGVGKSPEIGGHRQEAHTKGKPRSSHRREISPNAADKDHRFQHHQTSSSHPHKAFDGTRVPTFKAGLKNQQIAKEKDARHRHDPKSPDNGQGSKDGKRRSSSRRSRQHGRPPVDPGRAGRQRKSRSESRTEKSSKTRTDQKRKEGEPRVAHEWEASSHSEGTQQMGNSYVVRRSGPRPTSQAYMPQAYRAGEFDRDFENEYVAEGTLNGEYAEHKYENGKTREAEREGRISGMEMFGGWPVVELEYEKRGGSGQTGYKREARRKVSKEIEGKEKTRSRNGHKRHHHVSSRDGGSRSKENDIRSHTPVFGVL